MDDAVFVQRGSVYMLTSSLSEPLLSRTMLRFDTESEQATNFAVAVPAPCILTWQRIHDLPLPNQVWKSL